jgi:hypothetical protein
VTPEPITLEGKKGTIAYFDRTEQMTTADKAVKAKVVFEDGSHLWLWLAPPVIRQ